ncbi:MAG: mechanosensitive ion channel [Candidatus Diapherotrites archaeon]|nr:mechanosensitive ion channel [Candidatus Diapherotrites archaeon]
MTDAENTPKQQPLLEKLKNPEKFRQAVIFAILVLAVLAIILAYSSLIIEIVSTNFFNGNSLTSYLPAITQVVFLIFGTAVFLTVTKYVISKHLENRGKKKEIKLIVSLYSYVVWALMIVLIASTLFKDIGIFLASLGLIGFGLTLALQKPILNLVGWLVLVLKKPFNLGDRIEVAAHRGDVTGISIMHTTLQGTRVNSHEKSEQTITIPNELILTTPVMNYTKRFDFYWDDLTFMVTYDSNWKKAEGILFDIASRTTKKYVTIPVKSGKADKKELEDAIFLLKEASKKLSKGILKESLKEKIETMKTIEQQAIEEPPSPHIRVDALDSGIGLNVLYLADIRSIRRMRTEITRSFLSEAEKQNDVQIAYPHMQIVYDQKNHNPRLNKRLPEFSEKQEPQATASV